MGFPGGSDGKESACNVGDLGSISRLGKSPWQPTPVFLPGESQGRRSLAGSPRGCKELDMTERLHTHTSQLYFNYKKRGKKVFQFTSSIVYKSGYFPISSLLTS